MMDTRGSEIAPMTFTWDELLLIANTLGHASWGEPFGQFATKIGYTEEEVGLAAEKIFDLLDRHEIPR